MTKKEKFIQEFEELIAQYAADHEIIGIDNLFSPETIEFWTELKANKVSKEGFTENGAKVLSFMQENESKHNNIFNAKIIGEELFVSYRAVSGSMRKLVADGYVEKVGSNPVCYSLTELGRAADATPNVDKE